MKQVNAKLHCLGKKEKNLINTNKFNKLWKLYIKFMDEKIVVY